MDLKNLPLPSKSNAPVEKKDATASAPAKPFSKPPTIAGPKSSAQRQREYRQRLAASRTPAQSIATRILETERKRNYRLRKAANLAHASGSLESTTASSSRSAGSSNDVQNSTQRQLTNQQRQSLAAEPARSTVQPGNSLDQIEVSDKPISRAQRQREYRQRIAASRTPAQSIPRISDNERKHKYRLRKAANLAFDSDSLELTTASSSRSAGRSNDVQNSTSILFIKASTSATTSKQRDARNKRKGSLPEAKTIIKSVFNYLQMEYENLKTYTGGSCDLSPMENILGRTSAATGVSEEEVTAVLEEGDSDDSSHESLSKLARMSRDYYDENISPIEEDSSEESAGEAQSDNRESSIESEENPIEILKVEIDENMEYHSKPDPEILFQMPFSREQMSVLQQSSLSEPRHAEVKQEPADVEEQHSIESEENLIETLKVEIDENVEYHSKPNTGISFQIPLSREQMSVFYQTSLTAPTHAEVKQEPADVEEQQQISVLHQSLSLTEPTHAEVKQEPADVEEQQYSPFQVIGDIAIKHHNSQMEVNNENLTIDHVQKSRQTIGVRPNKKPPKTPAERAREFRARQALLRQQSKQQKEPDAINEIATEDIQSAGPSQKQAKTAAQRMREYRRRKKF